MSDKDAGVGEGGKGGASIMEGGKRQAEGEAAVQDRETRKKAKVLLIFELLKIHSLLSG